jgi:hypothetical protein
LSTRKAFRLGIALMIIPLAVTACITINVPAPRPIPTHTPLPTPSPTPSPTSLPEQDLEIKEKDEPLSADPELFQFSVTLEGRAVDISTREEVTATKVTFITPAGTYKFGSRFELTIQSGSVVRIVAEAPGYETMDVQMKPHYTKNATLEMEIPMKLVGVTPESL